MRIVFLHLIVLGAVEAAGSVFKYGLDNPAVCHQTNVVTKWLQEDDTVIVLGKTDLEDENKFNECVIKFGPSSDSRKKTVQIKIETYSNEECGVYLAVQQSPTAFFNEHVSLLFNFTCNSKPFGDVYLADANNNVKIFLLKKDKHLLNFNFKLNITLVEHSEVTGGISTAVIIGIALIVAIAIPGAGCIIYRYLKVKQWTKRQYESGFPQPSLSHMRDESPQGSTRYTNLPLGDTEPASSSHSHTCIVGSLGSDGLCTVCHRQHADFAHVVDIGPNGEIVNSESAGHHSRHNGSRSADRDGALHGSDSRSSTPRSRRANHNIHTGVHPGAHTVVHKHTPTQSNNGLVPRVSPLNSSHLVSSSGLGSSGEFVVDDDYEDDYDLSGNDLIPPSYDLSPPSYDEAVNMPKPDSDLQADTLGNTRDVSESDPLYQNIFSVSRDSR